MFRKLIIAGLLALFAVAAIAPTVGAWPGRTDICHNPGENQQHIEVANESLPAHYGHGDYQGPCRPFVPTPTPEPQVTFCLVVFGRGYTYTRPQSVAEAILASHPNSTSRGPCPTQTPTVTPGPTPVVPGPTPEVIELVPAPGIPFDPNCSLFEWMANFSDPECSPWKYIRFEVTPGDALHHHWLVVSGVEPDGQVIDWFGFDSLDVGAVFYSPAFQGNQEWTMRVEVLETGQLGELRIVDAETYDDRVVAGSAQVEDGDTGNIYSSDPIGGDWNDGGFDFKEFMVVQATP